MSRDGIFWRKGDGYPCNDDGNMIQLPLYFLDTETVKTIDKDSNLFIFLALKDKRARLLRRPIRNSEVAWRDNNEEK